MDPNPIILDISSDEDLGWDDGGDAPFDRGDVPFDWIAEFLDAVDSEKEESDDVVVVGEISGRSALRKQNQQFVNAVKSGDKKVDFKDDDDDDDDCLILDGDPDKPVTVDDGEAKESDELLIVGEKGQLACRDYPHPRHLCATYPFNTTPHQKHCSLCHCYVCDSIAPCIYWGTGVSNTDHCHSTDKEEIWKVRRRCFKQGKAVPSPAPKPLDTALSMAVSQHNSGAAVTSSRPVNYGSVSLSSQSQSNTLRPCSSSSFSVPNIISQRSNQRSGFVSQRTRIVHHANQSPLLHRTINATNNVVRRARSTIGPHFTSPHVNFKRVGTSGVTVTKNQPGYSSSFGNAHNHMSSLQKNHHSQVTSHRTRNQDFFAGSNSQHTCQSSSQPSMGCNFVELHPCSDLLQPQIYSQPDPLPNGDQSLYPQNTCQSSSQPAMGSDFVGFHPYIDSLQPQVYNQPNPVPNEDQNAHPPEDPHPVTTNLNLSDYDWSWLDDSTADAAVPSTVSALHQIQPVPEPPRNKNLNPQYPCIDDTSTEIHLESWIEPLDQNAVGAAKDAVSYEFDFESHEPDLDATSWLMCEIDNSKMVSTCSM